MRNNPANTKVRGDGGGRGAPYARPEMSPQSTEGLCAGARARFLNELWPWRADAGLSWRIFHWFMPKDCNPWEGPTTELEKRVRRTEQQ